MTGVNSGREGPLREHRDRREPGRLWSWGRTREDQGLGVSAVSKRCGIVSIGEVNLGYYQASSVNGFLFVVTM